MGRVEDLERALRWALQYGTFEAATDNPMHKRAHLEALELAGMIEKGKVRTFPRRAIR